MGSFFSQREGSQLDPIMAIDELFRSDRATDKINLVLGVFQNEEGETPVLESVKMAEAQLVEVEKTKAYLPIAGEAQFLEGAQCLIFGESFLSGSGLHIASVQTPGSTAALRIAADLIKQERSTSVTWTSTPGYSNHNPIFNAAGLKTRNYRYYDPVYGVLLFEEMLSDLASAAPGDVVLLHGCCHNPTGADLNLQQWEALAEFVRDRSLLPLIDAAYFGFASSIERDSAGMRKLIEICPEAIVAISFSKNFALYSERLGLLSFVGQKQTDIAAAAARAKVCIRASYTSPPSHGAQVVARILTDRSLQVIWLKELEQMRDRLLDVRHLLAAGLEGNNVRPNLFPALRQNRGMFTLSQLSATEVVSLRDKHHIYMLSNGRVSFGGMRKRHIDKLCAAIAETIHHNN